jgi:hypothetical protein
VPTPSDRRFPPPTCGALVSAVLLGLATTLSGCGGEPTTREVQNARAFEALLTAVSLRNEKELENDAQLIGLRHASGELSDGKYQEIQEIIRKARARDWRAAEERAYEFRAQCGDRGSFFR